MGRRCYNFNRVEDALNATRAAAEEGIVVGGGCALLYASQSLTTLKVKGDDQKAGVALVAKALQAPIRQITLNAGVDGSVVVGKLLEQNKKNQGYDAQNEEYVDMFAKGIIDPVKVVRTALQDAASIAGLLVTTEAMIADKPDEKMLVVLVECLVECLVEWAAWVAWVEWECNTVPRPEHSKYKS